MHYCDDIAAGIKTSFRTKEHYKHPLTRQQCSDLLASIYRSNLVGLRDYLMIQMMLTNGLRTCNVARINVGDFVMENGRNVLHIQRKGQVDKHDVVAVFFHNNTNIKFLDLKPQLAEAYLIVLLESTD